MREDIARSYVTKKKRGTMVHNPIGEGTGSIFAFGMIELWCLSEWMATALPGKQKNIYLDKCKERYVGTKTKTTEDIQNNIAAASDLEMDWLIWNILSVYELQTFTKLSG